jgi:hypothetical protein
MEDAPLLGLIHNKMTESPFNEPKPQAPLLEASEPPLP